MRRRQTSSYNRVKKYRYVTGVGDESSFSSDDDVDQPSNLSVSESHVSLPAPVESVSESQVSQPPAESDLSSPQCESSAKSDETQEHGSSCDSGDFSDLGTDSSDEEYYSNDSCSGLSDSSLSGSDEDSTEFHRTNNPIEDLKRGLKSWGLRNNITLTAMSQLLVFLIWWLSTHCVLFIRFVKDLPKDARTLFGTTTSGKKFHRKPMKAQGGGLGEYVYFGLKETLASIVSEKYFPTPVIRLCFNADGLPLYKGSGTCFWPIMCKIFDRDFKWRPFTVALYSGPGKPNSVEDYFEDFVLEMMSLLEDGILIKGRQYVVQIYCFICDTPARAFLKCIVGHGGFFCCERCLVEGVTRNKKRVYPENNCPLRTEESFLSQAQKDHHHGNTPLAQLPGFKPIQSFVLDFMHLICLGIMKRLLAFYWVCTNKKRTSVSIKRQDAQRISTNLEYFKEFVTAEFPRRVRGLGELARYKATEFRFFLLYCGPIALEGILEVELYKHFLLLHTATRILCCPVLSRTLTSYAKSLYRHFFDFLPDLYGDDSQIINMHNVIHLADDVLSFGCTLDELSAFDFENELGKIKRLLRSSYRPLGQYCRRKAELGPPPPPARISTTKPVVLKQLAGGTITKIKYLSITLSCRKPNNFVLLHNGSIVQITAISREEGNQLKIYGKVWQTKEDIFMYPCASSQLSEWLIKDRSNIESSWKVEEIKAKLIHLQLKQADGTCKDFAIAVLHSNH